MQPQLYFDISSEESGGSLFQKTAADGSAGFVFQHSTYNEEEDDMQVFTTHYPSFAAFWAELTEDPQWFYQHPLFVHPEVRSFVQEQLAQVDWTVQGDARWQASHRRQWDKVLSDPDTYYRSNA